MVLRLFVLILCILAVSNVCAYSETESDDSYDLDIHSMVVGESALELIGTQQLTFGKDKVIDNCAFISPDGKYVAYWTGSYGAETLYIVKATGGKPRVVMAAPSEQFAPDTPGVWDQWAPTIVADPVWSPDSRFIAFEARHAGRSESGDLFYESWVVIFSTSGKSYNVLIPKGMSLMDPKVWHPDSAGFAVEAQITDGEESKSQLVIVDVVKESIQVINTEQSKYISLQGWDSNGSFLLYTADLGSGKSQLRKVTIDGSDDVLVSDDYESDGVSPDGAFRIIPKMEGADVVYASSGAVVKSFPSWGPVFWWTPNSRLIAYLKDQKISDGTSGRSKVCTTIWLASIGQNKIDTMCVALGADNYYPPPSFSADSLSMAYVWRGQVFLAKLSWRDATIDEKQAVGIPLSEDEMKEIMMGNAKEIGIALALYMGDYDGEFPAEESFKDDIYPYLKSIDILSGPGTQDYVFKYYHQPNESEIDEPAETVIVTMDAGYSWQVNLYVDGHVTVGTKQ